MRDRFAIFLLCCGLVFGGCKKTGFTAKAKAGTPTPSANAAANVAASTPTPSPSPTEPPIDRSGEVIVFGYHRFEKKVRRPDTEITPEAFEAQMKQLQDAKIPVIGMQDFLAWKRGEKKIPSRAAIITIDDGYKSGFEVAWPILKKFGYPLTLFIYTEGIKGGKFGGGEAMSWEQLAEMRDAGVDIEAHSATHQDLRKPYDKVRHKRLTPEEYDQWLTAEVAGSKATLEQKLGIKVNCFAVPFGYYNDKVKQATKAAGFEAVFTVYGQKLTYGAPNDSLGRYMIEANKPKVFADAIGFGGSTSGGSFAVQEIPLTSINPQPADGSTAGSKPLIKAALGAIGGIDPNKVVMRISGLGVVPAKYDPATKTISYQVTQPLRGSSCSVILEAKMGDSKAAAHWTFTVKETVLKAEPVTTPSPSPSPSGKK
ncbi:MAG TPA: polysaccharide deacetylase family protein [Chthoniobacterales bacterium]|nr:polysaccharide deacetylase family protein [Chthoniobacterales bacterium]